VLDWQDFMLTYKRLGAVSDPICNVADGVCGTNGSFLLNDPQQVCQFINQQLPGRGRALLTRSLTAFVCMLWDSLTSHFTQQMMMSRVVNEAEAYEL
jgi:hypothetical protein